MVATVAEVCGALRLTTLLPSMCLLGRWQPGQLEALLGWSNSRKHRGGGVTSSREGLDCREMLRLKTQHAFCAESAFCTGTWLHCQESSIGCDKGKGFFSLLFSDLHKMNLRFIHFMWGDMEGA